MGSIVACFKNMFNIGSLVNFLRVVASPLRISVFFFVFLNGYV